MELLARFAWIAVEHRYTPWSFQGFSDKEQTLKEITKCYREVRASSVVYGQSLDVSARDAMCNHASVPAQPPRMDISNVRTPESFASLMKKSRSTPYRCGAGTSQDQNFVVVDVLFFTVVCLVVLY